MPYLEKGDLNKRMKAVSSEREQMRARERARMQAEGSKASLRAQNNKSVRNIVERFNLRQALVDQGTIDKLRAAGLRSQNALNIFLVARFLLPFLFLAAATVWVFVLGNLTSKPIAIRILAVIGFAYVGFYAPNVYVSNRMKKRQHSIKRAWPDALDLMLICVESGISVEAAMRRAAEEIGTQSPELAEELVLTTAELSFLQDRRTALENLGNRTQLDIVKSVMQALIQAERYGTPVAQALRVLAQEGRDERMNDAEKKAAALPPKLTVPMILFFLPVLVAVILGPAGIQIGDDARLVRLRLQRHPVFLPRFLLAPELIENGALGGKQPPIRVIGRLRPVDRRQRLFELAGRCLRLAIGCENLAVGGVGNRHLLHHRKRLRCLAGHPEYRRIAKADVAVPGILDISGTGGFLRNRELGCVHPFEGPGRCRGGCVSKPVLGVTSDQIESSALPPELQAWATVAAFKARTGALLPVAGPEGSISKMLFGLGSRPTEAPFLAGHLARALPAGDWVLEADGLDPALAALGFGLGTYNFARYKAADICEARLAMPQGVDRGDIERQLAGVFLARDLINTPTNDMGPIELEAVFRALAGHYGATASSIVGDDLLAQNFPLVHAVGRASASPPRLLEMRWGEKGHPRVTLVGKGVCFDTGGLDIKGAANMALMKKDMGGAANVLGLALMIMDAGLPVDLQVLVPAVENSISDNAFRPGDIYRSRKGITVQIDNTDAEGRLVLADALAYADETSPDLLVDMATLTGAARVALGAELAPFFTDDEALAAKLSAAAQSAADPVWRLPLWMGYDRDLKSRAADITNAPSGGMAGSITAALFLKRFVKATTRWVHLDIYGWSLTDKPHVPVGGEAFAIRALQGRPHREDLFMNLDKRLNAFRQDLADERLRGKIAAARFVAGEPGCVTVPVAPLRPVPDFDKGIDTELLFGESLRVFDRSGGFAWVQADSDGYVGYLAEHMVGPPIQPTHRITAVRTFLYPEPELRRPALTALSMGSLVTVTGEAETRGTRYVLLGTGGAVIASHCSPLDQRITGDYVDIAARFLETPYLWGGRSGFGIDCSGLVQLAMMMAGRSAPRDSDMQAGFGEAITKQDLRRGDLVFWKGHVGLMENSETLLHANGHTMTVARENLDAAIQRIGWLYDQPTGYRRIV
eukprot:g25357.t1